jgi:hypothetical protein
MSGSAVNCPGQEVTLSGVTYVIPPMSAKTASLYWGRLEAMQKNEEPDPLGLTCEVAARTLRRNYPEMTDDLVSELIDFDNMGAVMAACFGKGAWKAWCESQVKAAEAGNAQAPAAMTEASAGAPSTQ